MHSRRHGRYRLGLAGLFLVGFGSICAADPPATGVSRARDEARRTFFEERVRPVLAAQCYSCHGARKQEGGLRVDWRDGLLRGGANGASVTPGQPDESLLLDAVAHTEPGMEMPKGSPRLAPEVVRDLRSWIADGAFDPRTSEPTAEESARVEWDAKLAERRRWWSLQPLASPEPPSVARADWPNGRLDRFILARLEGAGLEPSRQAEPPLLARRLAFVLTGLAPAPDDLRAFLADRSPLAYSRLVDRLLASPHFGEHWARHWMDVVRYGDTYGYEWDIPAKGAWRYRDYLVRAFNADVPFDRLVREQVAGDLLPDPRIDPAQQINESLIGPMFFQLGEKRHGDSAEFDGIHQEMLHNKIDALSKAFQGLTVGCARCHDHKLDAVSQRDYYALAGTLMSPRWITHTLDTPERNASALAELRRLKRPIRAALAATWRSASASWPTALLQGETLRARDQGLGRHGACLENPLRPWIEATRVLDAAKPEPLATAWRRGRRLPGRDPPPR
ncbi:MAG: DUF1549 domain-containing protein [Isosphaeraceae bacterium]